MAWIYRGCMAVIALMTVCWLLLSVVVMTWRSGWLWGVMGLVAAPMIGLVLLLIVRVACEAVLARVQRGGGGAHG